MNRRDGRGEPGRGLPSVDHLGADDPTASNGRSQNSGLSSTATGNRSRFSGLPSPLTKTPSSYGPSRGRRTSGSSAAWPSPISNAAVRASESRETEP